jgi:hypothetical protein
MWKSVSEIPRGNINIIITDKFGGFCFVRTGADGTIPSYRYMMKTHDDYYHSAKGSITEWMELAILRQLVYPEGKINSY